MNIGLKIVIFYIILASISISKADISTSSVTNAYEAKQLVVMDFATGKILLEKNMHELMHPSSMTKIMTSYIIEDKIQSGEISFDSSFVVSEKAWRMQGSKSFMPLGESVRLEDILRGIIIQSGNDACIVAAEALMGSEENFADLMNEKAKELGMNNTHFVNSTGWPNDNHYSTAYDLAILGRALIRNHSELYYLYSETNFTFGKDAKGRPITQGNRNPLLYKDVGCDGIKTGSTDDGGYGIVASFVDNDRRYIMVINGLSSMKKRAHESLAIVSWVKQNFIHKKFYSKHDIIKEIPVELGQNNQVALIVSEDVSALVQRSKQNAIDVKLQIPNTLTAPVKAGDVVGEVRIVVDGEVYETAIIARDSIEKIGFFQRIIRFFSFS